MKYVLLATATDASYKNDVSCTFYNQLSKIQIKLEGEQATDIESDNDVKIYLKTYKSCTSTKGKVTTTNATADYIQMHKATYGNDTYWAATVVHGYAIEYVKIDGIECKLSASIEPVASSMHVITLSLDFGNYKRLTEDITISDNNTYYFAGSSTHSITINGSSSPTIYLKSFNESVSSGNAISITDNSTPTFNVAGANNSVTSSKAAGIFVERGSTVSIKGSSSDDVLKVTGSGGSSGIGGYVANESKLDYKACGKS